MRICPLCAHSLVVSEAGSFPISAAPFGHTAYVNPIQTNNSTQDSYVPAVVYQTGSNPVVTSSALIIQGPVSNFGNEKQVPINTFLKVETTVGNLTASNLSETGNTLTYDGTVSSSAISASSAFFSLDVLISGVLKVVNKIYAYAGIIGDITGSLSGSNIIVNTITSSVITASNIISTNNDLFVVTSSVISSSTLISNNNTLVNVTSSNRRIKTIWLININ